MNQSDTQIAPLKQNGAVNQKNPTPGGNIPPFVYRIIILAVVYLVLNWALGGIQNLWHRNDTRRIESTKTALENERRIIDELSNRLDEEGESLSKESDRLDELKASGSTDEYNEGVESFNSRLRSYKADVDLYNQKITNFNKQVGEINELIKKIGSRWYIIPIPIPKSGRARLP